MFLIQKCPKLVKPTALLNLVREALPSQRDKKNPLNFLLWVNFGDYLAFKRQLLQSEPIRYLSGGPFPVVPFRWSFSEWVGKCEDRCGSVALGELIGASLVKLGQSQLVRLLSLISEARASLNSRANLGGY